VRRKTVVERCDSCAASDCCVIRNSRTSPSRQSIYSSSSNIRLHSELVKCRRCELVFVSSRNRQTELSEAYAEAVDLVHSEDASNRIASFSRAMSRLARRVKDLGTRGVLVDIGCASGEFPYAASQFGFDVIAYEPSRHLSSLGRERYNLDIRSGIFRTTDFQPGSVNVVTLWDVLEHLESPSLMLQDVHEVLKERGLLILNLPMIDTLSCRLLRYRWPFFLEVHLFYFTRSTIRNLLELHGFKVLHVQPYSQTLSSRYLVRRATGGRVTRFPVNVPFRYRLGQRTIVAQKVV
jgi:hypothetical protein